MDQESTYTEYDELVQTRELQILKSMLPFVPVQQQMPLALFIQYIQFQNTVRMFQDNTDILSACAVPADGDRRNAMLQTIRKYCTPKEKETIDTLLNIMCVMENYDAFST